MNKPKGKMTDGPWHVDARYREIRVNQSADPDINICSMPLWLDEHIAELKANAYWISKAWALPELLEAITALKALLSSTGDYSICRSDQKPMELPEVIHVGQALENISKAIAKIEGGSDDD